MKSLGYVATSPAERRKSQDEEELRRRNKYHAKHNPMSFKCQNDTTITKPLVCRKGKWTEAEKNACKKVAQECPSSPHKAWKKITHAKNHTQRKQCQKVLGKNSDKYACFCHKKQPKCMPLR